MIPEWYTYAKDAATAVGLIGSVFWSYTRIVYRLGQSSRELKGHLRKQDHGVDWANETLEMLARRSMPPGSDPPKRRPQLESFTDLDEPGYLTPGD